MSTQRAPFTTFRLGLAVASVVIAACGIETPADAPRTLAVQPRVIVDGMVELAAVAGSRVIVDEVLFHAPSVTVEQSDGAVDRLLARGESPLLFRYDSSSSDGFGDVLGAEREWTVRDVDGELVVGFAPLAASLPAMTDLEAETGVELGDLRGHTALVHGYLLVETPDLQALGCDAVGAGCTAGGSVADDNDGDPDGNPSEGDPDGNPAKEAEGDPDGNPAKEAEGDPDGNPADGDPDGNPSQDPDDAERRGQAMSERADRGPIRAVDRRVASVKVPFFLVLNRAFSLHVPVAELFETQLSDDEVRPLELHVRLDELLSEPMLELLNDEATDTAEGAIVVEVPNEASVGLDVDNQGVVRRVRANVSTGGIRVVGGR